MLVVVVVVFKEAETETYYLSDREPNKGHRTEEHCVYFYGFKLFWHVSGGNNNVGIPGDG